MVLPIKHNMDWELYVSKSRYNLIKIISANIKIVHNNYKERDKTILNNSAAYKYETF